MGTHTVLHKASRPFGDGCNTHLAFLGSYSLKTEILLDELDRERVLATLVSPFGVLQWCLFSATVVKGK